MADVAKVMKADFDTAFCNFLNFEIEQVVAVRAVCLFPATALDVSTPTQQHAMASLFVQEEGRLRALGIEPVGEKARWLAVPPAQAEDGPPRKAEPQIAVHSTSPEAEPAPGGVAEQRWLLVLRTFKQGVYALLAREREVKNACAVGQGAASQLRAEARDNLQQSLVHS